MIWADWPRMSEIKYIKGEIRYVINGQVLNVLVLQQQKERRKKKKKCQVTTMTFVL